MPMYNINGERVPFGYDVDGRVPSVDKRDNQSSRVAIFVNQCGYDIGKPKIATVTNVSIGTFTVRDAATDEVAHSGSIAYEKADFTDFNVPGSYYIQSGSARSGVFRIAENRLRDVSLPPALAFMEQSRQDAFDPNNETGIGWRDSHQFSFELPALALLYMSNPTYWDGIQTGVYKQAECEYEDLRTKQCPNIVWLMLFAVRRYHDWSVNKGVKLHGLIKEQVAYFLWLYPQISQWVDESFYKTIRSWLISIWGDSECNKKWYAVDGEDHNLYHTQAVIGTVKGQYPAGHAVVPNFMMYEVCKRDGLKFSRFLSAATDNMDWLVNEVDLDDPANLKGQRMSEWVTVHNLTFAFEHWPQFCPMATGAVLENLAALICSRSCNKWDYTMFAANGDYSDSGFSRWNNMEDSGGLANQPGNVAGMMGVCYMLRDNINTQHIKDRLDVLAVAHIDHVYGRNPLGRHFCYNAPAEFDGATSGWPARYHGGYGNLEHVTGVLDGSTKEWHYPFNPSGELGYTEGWVAHNTPWLVSLSCLMMR